MKYNRFIENAPLVSEIGLGAWQLGINSGWKGLSDEEAAAMVHTAMEQGVNFLDTSPSYGLGTSEARLGAALRKYDRNSFVINTKFGYTDAGITNFSAGYIRKSLEGSLKRLQMDYVDSLIIHNPPFPYLDGNKNDHYEILEKLKEEGKIKAYGASLDTYEEINSLLQTTNSKVIEVFFNILHQDVARAFEMAKEKGVGIIVKIPLDSGWLSGGYDENSVFSGVRKRWSARDIQTRAGLVNRIKEIIKPETNLSQIAMSFCLAYDAVSTVIPGNTNMEQLKSNLSAVSRPVSVEMVKRLEDFFREEVAPLKIPW